MILMIFKILINLVLQLKTVRKLLLILITTMHNLFKKYELISYVHILYNFSIKNDINV